MPKEDPWFFRERAVAFASLVLTSRDDVKVQPYAGPGQPIRLLVEALKDGKPTLRCFGVELIPYMDLSDMQTANGRKRPALGQGTLGAALPLCVFVIGVRKPDGICRWIVEPAVEEGRAVLCRDVKGDWQPLNATGTARLIDQVNAWYDALTGASTPKPRGRHAKVKD